ncbi:MAG: Rpn family recombination-promoting nuclease/putative transposase [Mogibacterium sp.]|uniref:Rpn family recombination-promoting nuclease/putative transposase n=1 Tax=Mogibacterium sp. TaxID=2049035 RepID=UPI001A5F309C|nr:Rpn family recombination-promoting nuclease/putative transposase [Mogibacterium sp.]MBL6469129.1 Rpn family recombination-promoting nuclease/putative transposase [Mogibacterium sp.]
MSTKRKYKTYKELSFTDDFLFCNIMQNNPDICKELVELLLDRKVGKVAYSETQKSIDLALDQKGVRLDVYFEDDLSTAYNIEMQTANTGNLPKRSRYYQGTVDLNMISSGAGYDELKKSYIIFINTFDLFGKGFPKYTFENICQESSDLHLDDGTVKVFINAKSTIPGISPELQGFLRYLCGDNPNTPLTDRIQNEVVKSRNNVRWERSYMLLEEKYKAFFAEGRAEGRELGLEEGREEGRAEGRAEGRIDTILEMFESGYLPLEVALKETGLASEAALQAYIKERKESADYPNAK